MNNVQLIGRIGRDLELKTIGEHQVVSFSLGVKGRKKDECDWIICDLWGKSAATLCQYAGKGDEVAVEGSLSVQEWDDKKTGDKREKTIVKCEKFHFLSGKSKKEPNAAASVVRQSSPGASEATYPLSSVAEIPF